MVHLQNSYNMLRVQGVFASREPAYRQAGSNLFFQLIRRRTKNFKQIVSSSFPNHAVDVI
jgi:hypothetical protein